MYNCSKSLLFFLIVIATIFSLIVRVYTTWNGQTESFPSLDKLDSKFIQSFIGESDEIGWIRESKPRGSYVYGADFEFVLAQIILAPALLKNGACLDRAVYNYSNTKSLGEFCQKYNYEVLRLGWTYNLALLKKIK